MEGFSLPFIVNILYNAGVGMQPNHSSYKLVTRAHPCSGRREVHWTISPEENFCFHDHVEFGRRARAGRPEEGDVMLCYGFISRIASSVLKVNCYQWGSCVGGPSVLNSSIWTQESFTQHVPTRQPPLWFFGIVLKFSAQLSISITIFQVFGMTRLWLELTTFPSGGKHSTFTLPVGSDVLI